MSSYLFFDCASTTRCCDAASELIRRFAIEDFGNPSSSHEMGQLAAKAIQESRQFFAQAFGVSPQQVVFTGSGSESDNLAIYGVALDALAKRAAGQSAGPMPRVLCTGIEHAAVKKTAESLRSFGIDVQFIPVQADGAIPMDRFLELVTPETLLISVQQVNNIVGAVFPVEELARAAKAKAPSVIFHTDSVQAFGKVPHPKHPSPIDLVSVSGHKIEGPKGIGALIILNSQLTRAGLRPLIWGGDQEGGFRSGTQNAGLIAGFHAAARITLENMARWNEQVEKLRERFQKKLTERGLLSQQGPLVWNSPESRERRVPHIVSLSAPGYPSPMIAKLVEEKNCMISTGSACSSQKAEPDHVLAAMGHSAARCQSAIRVSFCHNHSESDVDHLVEALDQTLKKLTALLGGQAS